MGSSSGCASARGRLPEAEIVGLGIALRRPAQIDRLTLDRRDARIARLDPAEWAGLEREVEVVNDSELVARQMRGEYKVKNAGLKPLFLESMRKLREFDSWAVRSVRREDNERADELVNAVLDEARGG